MTLKPKDERARFSHVNANHEYALIALRDLVVFPHIAIPISVQRKTSMAALDFAMKHERMAIFVTQKEIEVNEPAARDLFQIGTLAKIREVVKQPDNTVRILIEGVVRVKITKYEQEKPFHKVKAEIISDPIAHKTERTEALMYSVINQFKECVNMGITVPLDILLIIVNIKNPWQLCDLIALNIGFKVKEKQSILEAQRVDDKLRLVSVSLARQIRVLRLAKKMETETGKEINKMQKEMFLREQMKAIEKELGTQGGQSELDELKKKIEKAKMPKEVREKALKELARMMGMPSFSPEISYIRTYLDWLVTLPWSVKHEGKINVKQAEKILNVDHYGLKKIKERILEYLSVQKLVKKIKGPILCFVGPPGTGKTSIGKSIARALGRKFFRMSVGGIHDEAEIRGHRRTYVGALPGRIIQGISTAKEKNPVFMLDEIDKIGSDFRGDPSSALLEALDPEQNYSFSDHYLEVPFDLSDTMFITTANLLDTIPPALRDRMEVIEFPGYTEEEKFHIAKQFLVPKQFKDNGLTTKNLAISDDVLRKIIREYTREAGVRNLEREIASICRKVARKIAEGEMGSVSVAANNLHKYLGPQKFFLTSAEKKDEVGVVNGLAWTEAGGEILQIEATKMPGKGQLILTGHLGKVMQESVQAAYSFARVYAAQHGKKEKIYKDYDIHVHVPSGAIPKDGPSAGIAMACTLVSLFLGKKVDRQICMTGELTLRGKAMEIGGVKEKVLAAHRGELKTVILPKNNQKDLEDIPEEVRKKLKFVFVEEMEEVLKIALKE